MVTPPKKKKAAKSSLSQLPAPPRRSAISNEGGFFALQKAQELQPLRYKNSTTDVIVDFPYPPDLTLKMSYTGDLADLATAFFPILRAVVPAFKLLRNMPYKIAEYDTVTTVQDPVRAFSYAVFILRNKGWPDGRFRKDIIDNLLSTIQEVVRKEPGRSDFVIRHVHVDIKAWFPTQDASTDDDDQLNEFELIRRFLADEFEMTYKDTDDSIITTKGVERHFLFIWMAETRNRNLDCRALVNDHVDTIKKLHHIITEHQLPIEQRNGMLNHGRIVKEKRRHGIMNFAGEKSKDARSTDCFIGMKYKRKLEVDLPWSDVLTYLALRADSTTPQEPLRENPSKLHRKDIHLPTSPVKKKAKSSKKDGTMAPPPLPRMQQDDTSTYPH